MPISNQPPYANAVIKIETSEKPVKLLQILHNLEGQFGRVRRVVNEARILDLDLIDYTGTVIMGPEITLPHPRMTERLFVLLPLQEIAPDWVHPITGKSIQKLIEAAPPNNIQLWDE